MTESSTNTAETDTSVAIRASSGQLSGRGLKRRIVLALALVIFAIQAIVLYFDDRGFEREQLLGLQSRAQLFADLYAGTVAQAFWEYSDDVTTHQLQTLVGAVPEFRYAVVTAPDDSIFASAGALPASSVTSARADILHEGNVIGRIDIYLTRDFIQTARLDHLRRQSLVGLALSALLLIAILAALHLVTRPLGQLTALMGRFARGDLAPAVPHVERRDEVGDMARALEVFRDHAVDLQETEASLQQQATELSALNQRLRAARDQAERASRIKSEFLSNMSHELRTPMNAVLGFAQLLELDKDNVLVNKQREYVGLILSAGRHLLSLIDDVLDVARIESGKVAIHLASINVEDLLLEFARGMRPIAGKSGIRFDAYSQLPADLMIHVDRVRLLQALNNLGTNAIKYNAAGGLVQLRALRGASGDRIRLEIRDSGIGIPAARHAELFKPFNRLGQERGAIEGTGIGLALTRQLVDLMGGEIGFQSAEGTGSTFWVELPADEMTPGVAAKRSAGGIFPAAATGPILRPILAASATDLSTDRSLLYIAEDVEDLALMEEIVATMPAIRFLGAPTGRAGLLFARCNRPRVVLIDLALQDMSGKDALRLLRLDLDLVDTTFIALTTASGGIDRDALRQAGFDHCVEKPVDMVSFLAVLRKALEMPGRSAIDLSPAKVMR